MMPETVDLVLDQLRKYHKMFGKIGQTTTIWEDAADTIMLLQEDIYMWQQLATKRSALGFDGKQNSMVCIEHGQAFIYFEVTELGQVYWCDACNANVGQVTIL